MKRSHLPPLAKLLNYKLLSWGAVLFIVATVTFGTIFYVNSKNDLETHSTILSTTLARYVKLYIDGAVSTLNHISLELKTDNTPQLTLVRAWAANQRFSRLLLITPDKSIAASVPSGLTDVDFPIPLTPFGKEGHKIGPPTTLENGAGMVVYLAHQLDNGYMLVGALKLDAIQEHIAQIQPGNGEGIILTDKWGTVITHPDKTAVRQQANLGGLPFYAKNANLAETKSISLQGISYMASATVVPDLHWVLITTTPTLAMYRDIMASVAQFLLFLLLLFGIFSVSFALEIQHVLSKPFSELAESMKNLAKGSYNTDDGSSDTIEELAILRETFNTMAGTIQTRETELFRARTYIKTIINSMPSIIISMDTNMRITHLNTAAENWCGHAEQDSIGKDLMVLCPSLLTLSDSMLAAQDQLKPILLEKHGIPGEDGAIAYQDILIYPLTEHGLEGTVLRIDDVTKRVRLEEMMVQTEKMMSVGGLAAGMAHEINNPLGAILQGAQNIERRLSDELDANLETAEEIGCSLQKIREYLEKRHILLFLAGIREAGTRAANIVANMLDFARSSEARRSTIDMHATLDRALELANNDYDMKKRYDFRTIEILRDYDPNLKRLVCSSSEIEQVILNLLRNAAQALHSQEHGNKGAPRIIIRTRQEQDAIRIEIEDNGPGMSEQVRKRVFEPFFTTKEIGVGTGLGLSVSYFIITENHKGSFDVVSAPGAGARFIIRLPASLDC